jgi:hypothetical protein
MGTDRRRTRPDRVRLSAVLVVAAAAAGGSIARADENPTLVASTSASTPTAAQDPLTDPTLPPDVNAQVRSLAAKLDAQSAEIAKLRAALEQEKADARAHEEALKPPPPPPPPPPAPPPLFRFSGFLQVDFLNNEQSSNQLDPTTSQVLNQDRFELRRVRPRVDIDHGFIAGVVQLDLNTVNGVQVRPWDVEVMLRYPPNSEGLSLISLSAGLMLIPFGLEVLQSDTDRLFLERSNMEQAFWNGEHDLGIGLQGGWRFLRYAIALMNGFPIGDRAYPLVDPTAFKTVVGRLGADTGMIGPVNVRAGVSGAKGQGFHSGTPATKPTIVWHDLNDDGVVESNEIQVIPGQDATPSQSYDLFGVGADLGASVRIPVVGSFEVFGEVETGANLDRSLFPADPIAEGRDLREIGYYVGATQEITEYGQIGVRYDWYQPDMDAADNKVSNVVPRDASVSTLAMSAALRFHGARLVFEYDHNTNHEGRTLAGLPTTLPDDLVGVRAELKF